MCDLRERDQIEAMVEQAVDRLGGLDVLVNNAGVIETSLTAETAVDELPEEVWDTVYEINLKAVWLATKFAAPHLRRSARGPSIVNAASVSGLVGFARAPIYCASKGGVVQLTRVTAIDLAPRVRCNCFCPGLIETPMARAFIDRAPDPAAQARARWCATQLVERLGTARRGGEAGLLPRVRRVPPSSPAPSCPIDGGALAWHGVRG